MSKVVTTIMLVYLIMPHYVSLTSAAHFMYFLGRKMTKLKGRISTGLYPLKTTGDGNCLFNAASIALTGSENSSITFRLASVLHAVQHFDHYKTIVSITL